MRQKIARLIHHVNGHFAIGYAYVHVQSKNKIRTSEQLHVLNNLLVTFALGDVLVAPVRKRMRADRGDLEPCLAGELGEFAAKIKDVCARVLDRIANLSAELDHGLVHLGFDLLFEHDLAALENFLNVRTQLARVRINNREFLLNPESKGVLLGAHSGAGMFLKNNSLSSRVGRMWSARGAGPVSISPEARPVHERMSEALCRSFARFGVSGESS